MADAREEWMADLRVTTLRAVLVPVTPWTRTARPEVTIRGAFGAALYDVVCMREDRSCERFAVASDCLIPVGSSQGAAGSRRVPTSGSDASLVLRRCWRP